MRCRSVVRRVIVVLHHPFGDIEVVLNRALTYFLGLPPPLHHELSLVVLVALAELGSVDVLGFVAAGQRRVVMVLVGLELINTAV